MLNIGAGEIAVIVIVALLVLGPDKLPELARGLGKFMREFRGRTDEIRNVVEREFYKLDDEVEALPPANPAQFGRKAVADANKVPSILPPGASGNPMAAAHPQSLMTAEEAQRAALGVEPLAPALPVAGESHPAAKVPEPEKQ